MTDPAATDRRLLFLDPQDNVCTAIAPLAGGMALLIQGREVVIDQVIPLGFKIAARDLVTGEDIIKYGVPIGHASRDIKAGGLVHLHNLDSNYLPTYAHRSE
ncbi:MAG: UxaA family hydrolase [Acidobacteriaceae bacterium]